MNDIVIRVPIQIELHIRCSTAQDVGPSLLTLSVEPKVEPTSVGRLPRQPRKQAIAKPGATKMGRRNKCHFSVNGGPPITAREAATQIGCDSSAVPAAADHSGKCKGHTVTRVDASPASSDPEGE